MKETTIQRNKIIKHFYNDVLKLSFLFFILGSLVIILVKTYRYNIAIYIFWYIICFGISFFRSFMKREIKNEFKKGDI